MKQAAHFQFTLFAYDIVAVIIPKHELKYEMIMIVITALTIEV